MIVAKIKHRQYNDDGLLSSVLLLIYTYLYTCGILTHNTVVAGRRRSLAGRIIGHLRRGIASCHCQV